MGPLQDPVTWYGINYAGTQDTKWNFQKKKVGLDWYEFPYFGNPTVCNLCPGINNSVPHDLIVLRTYSKLANKKPRSELDMPPKRTKIKWYDQLGIYRAQIHQN